MEIHKMHMHATLYSGRLHQVTEGKNKLVGSHSFSKDGLVLKLDFLKRVQYSGGFFMGPIHCYY